MRFNRHELSASAHKIPLPATIDERRSTIGFGWPKLAFRRNRTTADSARLLAEPVAVWNLLFRTPIKCKSAPRSIHFRCRSWSGTCRQIKRALGPTETTKGEDAPVIFADGVSSHAWGRAVSKFYLYRLDPSFRGTGELQATNAAQIVMTNEGFVAMGAFIELRLRAMMEAGAIKLEDINNARTGVGLKSSLQVEK